LAGVLLGNDYIYNPSTDKMELYNHQQHGALKDKHSHLVIEKGVDFGHAVTIHKSQGSTFKNVFFDTSGLKNAKATSLYQGDKQIGSELQSLIYVGLSRASDKLVIDSSESDLFYKLTPKKPLDLGTLKGFGLTDKLKNPNNAVDPDDVVDPGPPTDEALPSKLTEEAIAFKEAYEEYLRMCKGK
jgi:hypothetical protein